jgi:hypothetical protein
MSSIQPPKTFRVHHKSDTPSQAQPGILFAQNLFQPQQYLLLRHLVSWSPARHLRARIAVHVLPCRCIGCTQDHGRPPPRSLDPKIQLLLFPGVVLPRSIRGERLGVDLDRAKLSVLPSDIQNPLLPLRILCFPTFRPGRSSCDIAIAKVEQPDLAITDRAMQDVRDRCRRLFRYDNDGGL